MSPLAYTDFRSADGEQHLASFFADICEWYPLQRYILFGEVNSIGVHPTDIIRWLQVHITDRGLVLEWPRNRKAMPSWVGTVSQLVGATFELAGRSTVSKSFDVLSHFAKETAEIDRNLKTGFKNGFVQYKWEDLSHIARSGHIIWPVLKIDGCSGWGTALPFVTDYRRNKMTLQAWAVVAMTLGIPSIPYSVNSKGRPDVFLTDNRDFEAEFTHFITQFTELRMRDNTVIEL